MAITRWDPFGEVLKMQRDMDRIFSRMGSTEGGTATTAWMPRINVKQAGEDVAIHVELAGIKPEDVDIEVTDGVLTVRGERKAETERQDEGWMIRESSFGSFERSVVLPEGVDPASIHADFHDGMLEVHVPKALEAARPKTTKIAIGEAQTAEPVSAQLTPEIVAPPAQAPQPQVTQPQAPQPITH
jgi:HSP20 family protein